MPWGAFGLIWFCVTLSVLACFNSLFAMGSLRPRRGSPGRRRAGVSIRPMRWGVFGRAGLGDLWLLAGVSIRPLRWGAFGRGIGDDCRVGICFNSPYAIGSLRPLAQNRST